MTGIKSVCAAGRASQSCTTTRAPTTSNAISPFLPNHLPTMSNIEALIDVPPGAKICAERLCDHLPVAAIRRSGGTIQVLCLRHLSDAVRLKRRELARLDGLLNKIYLAERQRLQRFHTYDAERLPTGTLVLFQRELGKPLADQSTSPESEVPQRWVDVGHCFNGCVHVLEVLAGVLAFFAEGKTTFAAFVN